MSHPQNDKVLESWREKQEEAVPQIITEACDADLYSIHKDHKGEWKPRELTLLDAHLLTGLIKYSYEITLFDKNWDPVNEERQFNTLEEVKTIARKLRQHDYHGIVYHTIRKLSKYGYNYETSNKVWSF